MSFERSTRNRIWFIIATLMVALLVAPSDSFARIEAVKGKRYRITKQHGPWMIMVSSFRDVPREVVEVEDGQARWRKNDQYKNGKTAQEAADELVYELRLKGIPAYTFEQKHEYERVRTFDRQGRVRSRAFESQQRRIAVLAGNYPDSKSSIAEKTLKYTKNYHPKMFGTVEAETSFLKRLANGGIYRKTPGRPGPLSGAFLTINPLLSPEEAKRLKRDPLILKLNSGSEHSLLKNRGKYTLLVKTFYGKSMTALPNGTNAEKIDKFTVGKNLDEAALNAWQMVKTLRQRDIEAYVYHDRYQSIVTVGTFDSPKDPRIAQLQKLFGAKTKVDANTGQHNLTAEVLALPGKRTNDPPLKTWVFDPYPKPMHVPKL